jgi:hypothetical protein
MQKERPNDPLDQPILLPSEEHYFHDAVLKIDSNKEFSKNMYDLKMEYTKSQFTNLINNWSSHFSSAYHK